jgi:L-amino acid N-acyltransferase YncA
MPDSFVDLQAHVVPPLRRQRIGTQLIEATVSAALSSGAVRVAGWADSVDADAAIRFAEAVGFEAAGERLTRVECDLRAVDTQFQNLSRWVARPQRDYSVRRLDAEDRRIVAAIFHSEIARGSRVEGIAQQLAQGAFDRSPVLVARDGAIAGFMLVRREGECGAVAAQWVAPELRQTSAVAALTVEASVEARAGGVDCFRFEFGENVQHTARVAERLGGRVIRVMQPMVRSLSLKATDEAL